MMPPFHNVGVRKHVRENIEQGSTPFGAPDREVVDTLGVCAHIVEGGEVPATCTMSASGVRLGLTVA